MKFSWVEFKERTLFCTIGLRDGKRKVVFGPETSFDQTRFPVEVMFQDVDLSHCSFLHSNIDKVDFRYCEFAESPERFLWFNLKPRKNVLRDEIEADEEVERVEGGVKDENVIARDAVPKQSLFYTVRRLLRFARNDTLREEKYEPVRRLYLELKRNFEDKKDWNTAGDFHYGEMECRRKGRLGGWPDFLLVNAYYGASGYGERPWRALVCIAGLIISCTLFYWLFDFETHHTALVNLSSASDVGRPASGLRYWFWYSIKAAFWWRFGEQGAEPLHWLGKGILLLESVLSPFFIALFILALRRKVKR